MKNLDVDDGFTFLFIIPELMLIIDGDDDNGRKVDMRSAERGAAEGRHQFFNKPLVIKTTQNTSEKEVNAASFLQDNNGRIRHYVRSCDETIPEALPKI